MLHMMLDLGDSIVGLDAFQLDDVANVVDEIVNSLVDVHSKDDGTHPRARHDLLPGILSHTITYILDINYP